MKKVKVLRKFKDKRTNAIRHKGEIFEVSEERFKEIIKAGPYIEEVNPNVAAGETESKTSANDEMQTASEKEVPAEETTKNKKTSKKTAAE